VPEVPIGQAVETDIAGSLDLIEVVQEVQRQQRMVWDGITLTLAGIIWTTFVAVVGVGISMFTTGSNSTIRGLSLSVYGIVSIGAILVGLTWGRQPLIHVMQKLTGTYG
jgi:hypothetical protein